MSNKPAFSLDDTARAMSEQAKRRGIALSLETCREVVRILFDPADGVIANALVDGCLLYTSPSPRDRTRSRMPSSA